MLIEKIWPEDSWQTVVLQGRLAKAEEMPAERLLRNQQSSLLGCLQFSDKMQILVADETLRNEFGFSSKKQVNKVCRDFESLRNNLAHAQDIVTYDFTKISRLTQYIESMQFFLFIKFSSGNPCSKYSHQTFSC